MFEKAIYVQRRRRLREVLRSGLLLFPGNEESPMNYAANTYSFRQDSSFLYFWGLDRPGLSAVIDIDEDREVLFGHDPTVAEIVWTGPQPGVRQLADRVGVAESAPANNLADLLTKAMKKGRQVHFLPQYRGENSIRIANLFSVSPAQLSKRVSIELTQAVVRQRSIKAPEEVEQIERALEITHAMHATAMKLTRPGVVEREVAGAMEGTALSMGGRVSFPVIFSIHGETLHNPYHENLMKAGDIVVNDCGAESPLHYAGDITRTLPVGGRFTQPQKDVYRIVLAAQEKALHMIRPGIRFKDIHLTACKTLFDGMKDLGLARGDTDEAVRVGAHAMFFQCGLGHMMGLDVHDMENLGEEFVGYDQTVRRDDQFGLCYLRLAKPLEAGYVVTVEPGIYIIPALIDAWKTERKFEQFINYETLERYRDFGGVRVEDDVLVTGNGSRVLGTPIPKSIEEIEALMSR